MAGFIALLFRHRGSLPAHVQPAGRPLNEVRVLAVYSLHNNDTITYIIDCFCKSDKPSIIIIISDDFLSLCTGAAS